MNSPPCHAAQKRLNQLGHELVRETNGHRHPHIFGCCNDRWNLRIRLRHGSRSCPTGVPGMWVAQVGCSPAGPLSGQMVPELIACV